MHNNFNNKINEDVLTHIYSFLPIMNNEKNLGRLRADLRKHFVMKKWLDLYSSVFSSDINDADNYLNWLDNDICRWCNNDLPTLSHFTPKYTNILFRLCPKPYRAKYLYSVPSKRLIHKYFDTFDESEVADLDNFLIRINSSTFSQIFN